MFGVSVKSLLSRSLETKETILSLSTLINNSLQHYSKYPGVSYAGENTPTYTALKQLFE